MGFNVITLGILASTNISTSTPILVGDPYWSNVKNLLHGDVLVDSSSIPLSMTNDATTVSTDIYKYGTGSLSFNGYAFYYSADNAITLVSAGFTFECFFMPNNVSGVKTIFQFHDSSSRYYMINMVDDAIKLYSTTGGYFETTGTVEASTWYHLAWIDNDGTTLIFLNGVLIYSGLQAYVATDYRILYGTANSGNGGYYNGYLDECRLTIGVARYTSNFTPPLSPFPEILSDLYYDNVLHLLHFEGDDASTTITDVKGSTFTVSGDTHISTAVADIGDSSVYFDGSADRFYSGENLSVYKFLHDGSTYTVELSFQVSSVTDSSYRCLLTTSYYSTNNIGFCVLLSSEGYIEVRISGASTEYVIDLIGTTAITAGVFNKIAIVHDTSAEYNMSIYLNGTLYAQGNTNGLYVTPNPNFTLQFGANISNQYPFDGYIDEVRITKDVARYSTDYTPLTSQFPDL